MRILLIDNYDSFTWNLYHYLEQCSVLVDVIRNDDKACLETGGYDGVVVSPGPGLPGEAGLMPKVISGIEGIIPVFGVCLGMQAIALHYGAGLKNLPEVLHGRQCNTNIIDHRDPLFKGIPSVIKTGHYHSWVVDTDTLPDEITVTATDGYGNIMAISHRTLPVKGVQFHPESVLTPHGIKIIENWIEAVAVHVKNNAVVESIM